MHGTISLPLSRYDLYGLLLHDGDGDDGDDVDDGDDGEDMKMRINLGRDGEIMEKNCFRPCDFVKLCRKQDNWLEDIYGHFFITG